MSFIPFMWNDCADFNRRVQIKIDDVIVDSVYMDCIALLTNLISNE